MNVSPTLSSEAERTDPESPRSVWDAEGIESLADFAGAYSSEADLRAALVLAEAM